MARHGQDQPARVWGIPRGGGYVAAMLHYGVYLAANQGGIGGLIEAVACPEDAMLAVDDIVDSGRTAQDVKERYGLETYALVDRRQEGRWADGWIIFPWEGASGMEDDGRQLITRMLQIIGEDPQRPGLQDTPRRIVESWRELFEGYSFTNAGLTAMLTRFDGPLNPVTVEGISFVSTCEHHMMPYRGVVEIGYTPKDGVIGLSKLPKVVQLLARRLTIQERLTQDIIDVLRPVAVSACVRIVARHSCLSDRGVRDKDVAGITVASTENQVE